LEFGITLKSNDYYRYPAERSKTQHSSAIKVNLSIDLNRYFVFRLTLGLEPF